LEGEERSYIKKLKDLQGKLKDAEKVVSETWISVSSSKLTTVASINFQILNFWDSLELAKSLVFSLEDQIATTESSFSELKTRGVLEILQMELYLDHLKK
jgi:hypothetical protein